METTDIRERLADILREEARDVVDWDIVERKCLDLSQAVARSPGSQCPHIVFHFLSDADIRAKDADYASDQRVEIKRFVETGECNDSKPIFLSLPDAPSARRSLGWLLLLGAGAASLIWLVANQA